MSDAALVDAVQRIFADLADPQTVSASTDGTWVDTLWTALVENGLTRAWVDEALGGAGFDLASGFAIVREAGAYALPVPLVETLIANWMLGEAGVVAPEGSMTVAPSSFGDAFRLESPDRVSGFAANVAFLGEAKYVALLAADQDDRWHVVLVKSGVGQVAMGTSLAGDGAGSLRLESIAVDACAPAPPGLDPDALLKFGGVARAAQIAGALAAVLRLSVAYANERIAFGRAIGKFQAIQQSLARLAGEVAAANASAASAAELLAARPRWDDGSVLLECASAKIRCGEAAETASAIAHQVHGALGLTVEHILHRFTLRALGWRDDFGTESEWAVRLGRTVAAKGGAALWPMLAAQ